MYHSMGEIMEANREAGQVWFSRDTMRYWETELYPRVWPVDGGAFFLTSDRDAFGGRAWSVRFCDAEGRVETLSFQETTVLKEAIVSLELSRSLWV